MFLKGDHICLRALEPADVNVLFEWENDKRLWPISGTQIPFSKFVLDEFVSLAHNDFYTSKQLRLMVEKNNTRETIGNIDLFDFEPQHLRCGLGIFIHEDYRGQGAAAECLELVKTYCARTLLLKQIYAQVNESNTVSLRLFESAGFVRSGLKKAWNRTDFNSYEDVWFLQFIF